MFRSLSSRNSTSSSKRKKAERSSRRPESVTSSSTHRKHPRNDERSSKSEHRKATSSQPPVDGPSGSSSYYTTADRLNQLEPRSLTEEAIRSLGMQEEEWRDTYAHAEDLPSGGVSADKNGRFNSSYKDDPSRRYNEGLVYRSPVEETTPNDRSLSHEAYPQNSFGTSSHVQDQFPGQDPSTYAHSAFNPVAAQTSTTAYRVGDQTRPHAAFAASPADRFPQSGAGEAAEYYSQAPMQASNTGSQLVPSQAYNTTQNTSGHPTAQTESLMSNTPAYPAASYTTTPINGPSNDGQNYTYQQQHRPTDAFVQGNPASHGSFHNYSQSVPSVNTYADQAYNPPSHIQTPGSGELVPANFQNLAYGTAAGAAVAGAHSYHHHKMHQHNHSAPINGGGVYGQPHPRPYTSGNMAMQHKHKDPISKFVDWWKDYEDVRKMEEYTEYIGVCKYCFDPRSTAIDAPRKHHRGYRRSSDSLRRRSSDSLRRSYTNGSKYGRVDKDSRYHSSSDSERRSKKTSWLGAGIAAYGMSKVGKSLWQNSRDFDDTYSVKSGRKSDVSMNGSRRDARQNYSSGHDSRSEHNKDRKVAYDDSSKRSEVGTQSSVKRPEHTAAESRHHRDGRHNTARSGFVTAEGSRYAEEQIHVRHPSPESGYMSPRVTSRRGYKSRSRSQSPSLAQILGLTSSQKRTSATASRSSSPQQEGIFTGFFSRPPSKNRSKQNKRKGFFNFANSSSSSTNSDLAFGTRPKNGNLSKRATRKSSDEHLKATLLGIGATAAALGAVQRSRSSSKKSERTRLRNKDPTHATQRSRRDTSEEEEEGWESATDDESVSSGLAFGDFDEKAPRRQRSSESITSQSSGTDKWSWRWRRKSDKKTNDNNLPRTYRDDSHFMDDQNVVTSHPLRYVHPAPISSPMCSEARGQSSMPGAFSEQQYPSECAPIQQPQPIMPLQSSIFGNQTPPHTSHVDQHSPQPLARPAMPTELRRTQSSPVSSHTMRNAAIAGVAGAAAVGILSNGKNRARDDSPSNVRFDLTEKQAKKEERQQRKDDVKESKERAKEEARDKKERARLDRERALQEESNRKAVEDARRYAEEAERQKALIEQAENHQAQLREAAAAEAREREVDRQREEEIKEFMRNALAQQAQDAELKKQREAWEVQQMAAARRDSPPSSEAGPSTASRPALGRVYDYHNDHSQNHRNDSTTMPYATRSYEPSNEHSGQPLMDDDLIDPDFFTRRRSHSDLARHEELARKAAAKIVADLEDKYKDPAPSQAEFFAPKELFEPSKGKTKVHGPIDDTDYQVYHMSEDQLASMPNEPPPPYQPSHQFASLRDMKGADPWDIPKLNVIAPTPPASYAGSARGDKSPIIAPKSVAQGTSQESDADTGPQKSSKVSWGEDQTRFYQITTPESSQEHVVLPDEPPHGVSGLRDEYVPAEQSQAKSENSTYMASNSESNKDQPDEIIEEIIREAPFRTSECFYRQPFVESVDDIAFTLDSPGTEGVPPVQGFVEGEVDDANGPDDLMPHIPGSFDESNSETRPEDTFNDDIRNLSREVMQEQQAPHEYEHTHRHERPDSAEHDLEDYFTTGHPTKKRDKEARRASLERDQRSLGDEHRFQLSHDQNNTEQSTNYAKAGAVIGAATAVGALVHNARSQSPVRRKSEPEDFDHQPPSSSHSDPRDAVSQSTPTSPVYERRPSLPSHAFDDLDMLPGSKRPKKSKRNSLLNYPAIGSPLRSAMTWDEYIEPMDVAHHNQPTQSQSYENIDDREQSPEDTKTETRRDLPSPESERGAASVVSAPAGDEESGQRRKSRRSHREREKSTSPRRSASVAMSEPYENSRKHKRRSHRDDNELDDASPTRSRSSHSSKKDDEESRSKKKGGILSLFRRKTSDDVASSEQKRNNGDDERSKHHHRRQSSEHAVDRFNERRSSTSRSRSHAGTDDHSSRHSSSSRHRLRHHRDGSVDEVESGSQTSESRRRYKHRSRDHSRSTEKEFDDNQSLTSESRRKLRHRDRDLDSDDRRSRSRDSKHINEDESFLGERVEDEESIPLPKDDALSSSQAPESTQHPQESISLSEYDKMATIEQSPDSTTSPTALNEPKNLPDFTVEGSTEGSSGKVVEALSGPSSPEDLSPLLEHATPSRPIVPLRISSSTAVPLRFRRPPTSPSHPWERSASFSSPVAPSLSSPITPKAKRPLSTEFMHSTEFRPLYLLERTRKPQEQEAEQDLPSLPPSRSTSSSSLQSSEDWQSAAEEFDPSEHDNSSPPTFDQFQTDEPEDILGSAQTTPKATEFPQNVLQSRPHLEPEYYSWSDMEREEHLREEAERDHHGDLVKRPVAASDDQSQPMLISNTTSPYEDTEVTVNQDPMATDVWGEISDEELPTDETSSHDDFAEPSMQLQESEAGPSLTVAAKKRKSKKVAKLGTSSSSEIISPVRETPAELARRREKDAQDAVDTWFQPAAGPKEEDLPDASQVLLSESTIPSEPKIPESESLPAPGQEIEFVTQEVEPGSPLLSRKKSKKGKKKQKSVVLEQDLEPVRAEEFPEPQMVADGTMQHESSADAQPRDDIEDIQAKTAPDKTAHERERELEALETIAPIDAIAEATMPESLEQPDDYTQIEESSHTMYKAERKKKNKKAKKTALSIAVPVIATAALTASDRETPEQGAEDLATASEPVSSGDRMDEKSREAGQDNASSIPIPAEDLTSEGHLPTKASEHAVPLAEAESISEIGLREQQSAISTNQTDAESRIEEADLATKSSDLAVDLLPEQIALPDETQDESRKSTAVKSISETATEPLPVAEASQEGQAQFASEEKPEEALASSELADQDATTANKRSSWFSWLPGSRLQLVGEPKAELKAVEDGPEKPNALTQEPFERLLEQPIQHPEFVDGPILDDVSQSASQIDQKIVGDNEADTTDPTGDIGAVKHDETLVESSALNNARSQLEEQLSLGIEASTDNTKDARPLERDTPTVQSDPTSLAATSDVFEPMPAKAESGPVAPEDNETTVDVPESLEPTSTALDAQDSPSLPVEESAPIEDIWNMPSKKNKKGKKGKKVVKEKALHETASTSSPIMENRFLDVEVSQNENIDPIEIGKPIETAEPESSSNSNIQAPSIDSAADERIPATTVVEDSGLPSTPNVENTEPDVSSEAVLQSRESATERTEAVTTSVEPDVHERSQDENEYVPLHDPVLNAEPPTAMAEDEWAMPSSKKKKKKGKKGKQAVTEPVETAEDVQHTQIPESGPLGATAKIEDIPATPDVFETPAEGTSGQYFGTPADELADQYFVTPSEEIPERSFATSVADDISSTSAHEHRADSISHEQLRRLSLTPTQENVHSESMAVNDELLSYGQVEEANTIAQNKTREVSSPSEYEEPASNNSAREEQTLDHDSKPSEDQEVVKAMSQPVSEESAAAHRDPIDPPADELELVQPEGLEKRSDFTQKDEPSTDMGASHETPTAVESDPADFTNSATEQSQPQTIAETDATNVNESDAFIPISSKKSKKDKKKAKKAKQQEVDPEFLPEHESPTAFDEPTLPPVETKLEYPVAANSNVTPVSPQLSETELVTEDQPITRKLSKKEKRKAKKAATSGLATPLEDTPEQTSMTQDDTSNFPDTAAEHDQVTESVQVEIPGGPNVELGSTPLAKPERVREHVESSSNNQIVPVESEQLTVVSETQFEVQEQEADTINVDEIPRDTNSTAKFATLEPMITEEFLVENTPTNIGETNSASAENKLLNFVNASHDAGADDQKVALQASSEPAIVEDQAPSVLDQLVLSEEPAIDLTNESSNNDEAPVDIPTIEAKDYSGPAGSDSKPFETPKESSRSEEVVGEMEAQEVRAGYAEEPTTREEPILEPETVQESATEEPSTVDTDSVSVKLSKKEKRKAKKSKHNAEPIFESTEPGELQSADNNSLAQTTEEDHLTLTEPDQQTTETTGSTVPQPPAEDSEVFTTKLSKKAKKKAKKSQMKNAGFEVEEDDQPTKSQEPDAELAASANEGSSGESMIEPTQKPSTESTAQIDQETEQQSILESTTPFDTDSTQDPKILVDPGLEDTKSLTDVKYEAVNESERALDPQTADKLPVEPASEATESLPIDFVAETAFDKNLAEDISPESEVNDTAKIVEASGILQDANEDSPTTRPGQSCVDVLEGDEQPTEKVMETPMSEDKDEFFSPSSTSKKKKKKGKKAKSQHEIVETEAIGDKSVPDLPDDPDEPLTGTVNHSQDTNDEPVITAVDDTIQGTAEEDPSAVTADDWAFPTKQSKKEKRKAKKLKDLEEPPISESVEQEPIAAATTQDETVESADQPISQANNSEAPVGESAPANDPVVSDDWSFSRKPSKKEKRKAKKSMFIDEQKAELGSSGALDLTPEAHPLISDDQSAESLKPEPRAEASSPKQNLSAADPLVVENIPSGPLSQEDEATPKKDIEHISLPDNTSHDIEFAATLAAGLQDSGFDPSLVIDDPVFHRRASPTSVGEADPGEVTSTTKKKPKRNSSQGGIGDLMQDTSTDQSITETSQPTKGSANDDFSDALIAGLLASGFKPDALTSLSTDAGEVQDEPEEFAFAITRRQKRGKKSTRVGSRTPELPILTNETPRKLEDEAERETPAAIGVLPDQEPEDDRTESTSAERSADQPTDISTTRLAKPTFFHTSEVSQFLPVGIDRPVQSYKERIEREPQPSADVSMIESLVKDIPRPILAEAHAVPTTADSKAILTARVHNEPATWSFDNLEPNSEQRIPGVHQETQADAPLVSAASSSEENVQTVEAEPVSPVESTTKDRTSYLFQSPVDLTGFDKTKDMPPGDTHKQTRFYEAGEALGSTFESKLRTPPAPLPPSPSELTHVPLPPIPSRLATPPAPLPPSPSRQSVRSPAPLPLNPQPDQSPPLTRKKSLYDIGSPGPGHSSKAARRCATPQQSFREQPDPIQPEGSPVLEGGHLDDQVPILRPMGSNRSIISNREPIRSASPTSSHSAAPSLRRINRSLSGDLRAASRRREDATHGPPTTIPIEPPPTPPLQDEEFNGHGASRPSDMANIYEGWGDVRSSPTVSPTRPPSMRKRQSMHILDLEAKLDQLASENRYLQDAIDQTTPAPPSIDDNIELQDMLRRRDLQLQEKDSEIQQIRSLLEPLQREITKLTDVNNNLSEVNRSFTANNDVPYATLQNEHAFAHKQLQQTSQELEGLKKQHHELNDNMEDIVRQEIANALEDKNAEIRKLREELDVATQQIRLLQSEILASKGDSYLSIRDEDYFDTSCQKLCQHVQQWVLRFSKYSDNRMCRLTSDLTDEKIAARLDNAILDGSDVDKLLGDRVRRRDVFMSVVMTMIWEYVFTRYLFGMDREQRQKLKSLEKILSEVGPPRAVAQWRATTLTLLSRRPAFATQRNLDTEAVAQEIFSVLSALLPPPTQLEAQILSSLRNVLRLAVELSIEMRSQKAEYIMLPPLQPEYDTQGDLVRKVHFNAALMNERSGDYTSNDELERTQAIVKIVLFPLVVKKGDDVGEGEDEIVVCPAQVLVAGSKQGKKVVRVLSGAMDIDNPRRSNQSIISGLESGGMI